MAELYGKAPGNAAATAVTHRGNTAVLTSKTRLLGFDGYSDSVERRRGILMAARVNSGRSLEQIRRAAWTRGRVAHGS
jgi:hypothetical protein